MGYSNEVHSKADIVQRKKLANIRDATTETSVFINTFKKGINMVNYELKRKTQLTIRFSKLT